MLYLRKDAVPPVPKGFRVVDIAERRRRLSWVNASSVAELVAAARELLDRADRVPKELGDMAPNLGNLGALVTRVEDLRSSTAAMRALLDAHENLLELGLSDLDGVVSRSFDEYSHRVDRKPELVPHYQKLAHYGSLHGQSIAEGRASPPDAVPCGRRVEDPGRRR